MTQTEMSEPAAPLGKGKALLVLGGVVLAIAGFIALGAGLGLHKIHGGLLFITYWTGIRNADPAAFGPSLAGSLGGVAMAAGLLYGIQAGGVGVALWAVVMLAAMYALILGRLAGLVNMAMMLFLTIGTIPVMQAWDELAGMALSTLYAGVLCGAGLWLVRRRAARAAPEAG
ncbi:hypothetical protein ACFOD9_02565 [Novosphingobium bradum]|uniref:DUF1097 domain-containing protein n=1 Tax=Novosphingobium bradum TaxID=1737444 RepID=A0ABV7IQI8_9SPHN